MDDHSSQMADITNLTKPYNADKNLVFGQEYLAHFHRCIMDNLNINVVFSGDSTTHGDYIVLPENCIDKIFEAMCQDYGINNITCLNHGHSGASTTQWIQEFLQDDLNANPNLLVLRWGMNDLPLQNPTQFESDLRSGLTTIRASKNLANLSIILMTPNASNDAPNHRDDAGHQSINAIIRKAARDFHCCFIDTYEFLRDAASGVGDYWDNPYGDGIRDVHPVDVTNVSIVSKIFEVAIPQGFIAKYGINNFKNIPMSVKSLSGTENPQDFGYGVSLFATNPTTTYPYQGNVLTIISINNMAMQILFDYTMSRIAIRTGNVISNSWNTWMYEGFSGDLTYKVPTYQNNFVDYGNGYMRGRYYKDGNNIVHLMGTIKGISTNAVIFTLPENYRPTNTHRFLTATGAGTGIIDVMSTGDIKLMQGDASTWITLDGINFMGEQ